MATKKETLVAQWRSLGLAGLRDVAKESGVTLKSETLEDALEEAWTLSQKAPKADPPPPAVEPLQYEARISASHPGDQFRRAGYVFSRAWEVLSPAPSKEQLERLAAEKAVQVRIKG